MSITPYAVGAARVVRTTTLVLVIVMVVAVVAIQAFVAEYGKPGTAVVLESTQRNDPVAAVVARQESAGLTCSTKPTMTDVVVFQHGDDGPVTVLTFAQALDAANRRAGWVRQFCV